MSTYPFINPSTREASPINKIWYPEVALAALGLIGKCKSTAITTVPEPTPKTPWVKPAPKPPRAINKNDFFYERSISCFNPNFL